MVFNSPIGERLVKAKAFIQERGKQLPVIVGTVFATVLLMLGGLHVRAMMTPEAQKTMEELYDIKKDNGVELRELNTTKAQQELALSQTKTEIAKVEEMNARIEVCITKLQDGDEHNDETCDPETFTLSEKTSSGSSVSSAASSQGF